MKTFLDALTDGFSHIKELSDPEQIKKLRDENVLIDDEGYYSFCFGEHKEYELAIEPVLEIDKDEKTYYITLYKNRIPITERLWIKPV